jgi:hypothetical protein
MRTALRNAVFSAEHAGSEQGCAAEGCEIRGNSNIHRRQSRKMQGARRLAASSQGGAGEAEMRGNPEIRLAGTAEGCEIRGNSKIHRRHSEKMRGARKLAAQSER